MARPGVGRAARSIVAAACLVGGTAHATPPTSSSAGLRPFRHVDRFGHTFEDVCPERVPHQRRCFAARLLHGDASAIQASVRPAGPGDPSCTQPGAGGGGNGVPQGSMVPKDVLAAYAIPASTQADGKIVALVELPSVHAMADVNAYRKQFGIPALPACPVDGSGVPAPGGTACFARVGEDGTTHSVGSSDCPGWSGETGLDMDMVSAACPDCSIVVVEAKNTNDLDEMNSIAAKVVGAAAASNSWGGSESGGDDPSFYDNPGTLTLAASGDSGYLDEALGYMTGPNFPASAPTVIAVGGTTLSPKSGGQYSEVVWNDVGGGGLFGGGNLGAGGSGCSGEFPRPAWQMGSGFAFGSCSQRASVDISAAAQFNPSGSGGGIAAYDADDGGWNSVVGTSAASPLVAAIMVRLGLAGKDNHPLFYDHISDFNDVTSGGNDNDGLCNDVMCTAGKGWDGPTGLGTPNGERLALLVAPLPVADAAAPSIDASVGVPIEAGASSTAVIASDGGSAADSSAEEDATAGSVGSADAACADSGDCASDDSNAAFPFARPAGCSCRLAPTPPSEGGAGAGGVAAVVLALVIRRRGARAAARRKEEAQRFLDARTCQPGSLQIPQCSGAPPSKSLHATWSSARKQRNHAA